MMMDEGDNATAEKASTPGQCSSSPLGEAEGKRKVPSDQEDKEMSAKKRKTSGGEEGAEATQATGRHESADQRSDGQLADHKHNGESGAGTDKAPGVVAFPTDAESTRKILLEQASEMKPEAIAGGSTAETLMGESRLARETSGDGKPSSAVQERRVPSEKPVATAGGTADASVAATIDAAATARAVAPPVSAFFTSNTSSAPSVLAPNDQDPEGVRIVKEIVAERKRREASEAIMDDGWYNWLDDLLEYHAKHKTCKVRDAENHILYSWLKRQRIMFRKGKLEPEKLRILQLLKTNGFEKGPQSAAPTSVAAPRPASIMPVAAAPTRSREEAKLELDVSAQRRVDSTLQSELLPQQQSIQGDGLSTALLSGAAANQPINLAALPNLLSSLQAATGTNQLVSDQLLAAAGPRAQPQDAPGRVAGGLQGEAVAVDTGAAAANATSVLSSGATADTLASTLHALAQRDPLLLHQLPNLASSTAAASQETLQPRRGSLGDSTQAIVFLLQHQQQQQQQREQQQRQQQALLEQLLLEQLRQQQDGNERPN